MNIGTIRRKGLIVVDHFILSSFVFTFSNGSKKHELITLRMRAREKISLISRYSLLSPCLSLYFPDNVSAAWFRNAPENAVTQLQFQNSDEFLENRQKFLKIVTFPLWNNRWKQGCRVLWEIPIFSGQIIHIGLVERPQQLVVFYFIE